MSDITVDVRDLEEFFKKLDRASRKDFKEQIKVWFEAMGVDFLEIVQNEIVRKQVVDTRLLLNSFEKGAEGNIWKLSHGGLTLEVGTNVKYAKYVNDGHRQHKRWVPGSWSNGKFVYDPSSSTGMMLKEKFIEGRHYWDSALTIFERVFNESLDRKLQQWLDEYF